MQIKSKISNNTLYVLLCGELDQHTAIYARQALDKMLGEARVEQVIFDLSELNFMDSTGIGVLIGRYKKMKGSKVPIYICNPNMHIEKIFKMSGLFEIMPKIG